MITEADERLRAEIARYALRCTCDACDAFDGEREVCAYGYPTTPHRRLPVASDRHFVFCKAFELA